MRRVRLRTAARGPLLLALLLPACAVFSWEPVPRRPSLAVTGNRSGRDQTLAAASLPPAAELRFALKEGGRRNRLRLLYAWLEEGRAEQLLAANSVRRFSSPLAFAVGETVEVEDRSYRLNLVARDAAGGRGRLEVSAVVDPPDEGLLPVIRGSVPWGPSYHLLLRGEADGEPVFTVLLAFASER